MRDNEEAVQYAEGDCWDCEEVHCRNYFAVVALECCPSFGGFGTSRRFAHPAQDSTFGDVEAEHSEFPMNSRCAPRRILGNDPENEFTDFLARRPSAHADFGPRNPLPVQFEPCTMPANDGIRLHQDQRLSPPGPEATQRNPEKSIAIRESWLRTASSQDRELLTQREILQK